MALMCYSNLDDDDHGGTTTLDALHSSLEDWVLDLLIRTQNRAARLPAHIGPPPEIRTPCAVTHALQTIQLIRYAQEQLLDRNAYLRYLCPDCPRDEPTRCPGRERSRRFKDVHEALHAVHTPPAPLYGETWLVQARPAASKVFERLYRMAERWRTSVRSSAEKPSSTALVSHLYEMARTWRDRGLPDNAVDVDETIDSRFARDVMFALMHTKDDRLETTDARHSPVNFIAAILRMFAEQLGGMQAPVAREAVMAALAARNSAIEGDWAGVDQFSQTWLGISNPEQWRAAVEMALLGDWVDVLGQRLSKDPEIMELLSRHTNREHRYLQPLWHRQARGRQVRLLEHPVSLGLSLRELITDHRRPEDHLMRSEVADPRLEAVLAHLAPSERAVAMTYATQRVTWTQAAAESGAKDPHVYGERVRRKLKRLGKRHDHPAAAHSSPSAPLASR
ncbi:hypothetical protein [Streptomyces sp. WAC06128]|uniref:hypothetical protein n=1 Tax=Streptomyces sp. WAC06128 TaxID=2487426 RepID=UPI000F9CFD8B|nr:hypothetical protein [Streptomyces sp. WAC06128]RSS67615.1 hypothetical protein EF911_34240 [Streptomyces sp. WAC06128]